MPELTRHEMLRIMQQSGALDDLDISDEDFIAGHGREDTYVKVIHLAYELGMDHEAGRADRFDSRD